MEDSCYHLVIVRYDTKGTIPRTQPGDLEVPQRIHATLLMRRLQGEQVLADEFIFMYDSLLDIRSQTWYVLCYTTVATRIALRNVINLHSHRLTLPDSEISIECQEEGVRTLPNVQEIAGLLSNGGQDTRNIYHVRSYVREQMSRCSDLFMTWSNIRTQVLRIEGEEKSNLAEDPEVAKVASQKKRSHFEMKIRDVSRFPYLLWVYTQPNTCLQAKTCLTVHDSHQKMRNSSETPAMSLQKPGDNDEDNAAGDSLLKTSTQEMKKMTPMMVREGYYEMRDRYEESKGDDPLMKPPDMDTFFGFDKSNTSECDDAHIVLRQIKSNVMAGGMSGGSDFKPTPILSSELSSFMGCYHASDDTLHLHMFLGANSALKVVEDACRTWARGFGLGRHDIGACITVRVGQGNAVSLQKMHAFHPHAFASCSQQCDRTLLRPCVWVQCQTPYEELTNPLRRREIDQKLERYKSIGLPVKGVIDLLHTSHPDWADVKAAEGNEAIDEHLRRICGLPRHPEASLWGWNPNSINNDRRQAALKAIIEPLQISPEDADVAFKSIPPRAPGVLTLQQRAMRNDLILKHQNNMPGLVQSGAIRLLDLPQVKNAVALFNHGIEQQFAMLRSQHSKLLDEWPLPLEKWLESRDDGMSPRDQEKGDHEHQLHRDGKCKHLWIWGAANTGKTTFLTWLKSKWGDRYRFRNMPEDSKCLSDYQQEDILLWDEFNNKDSAWEVGLLNKFADCQEFTVNVKHAHVTIPAYDRICIIVAQHPIVAYFGSGVERARWKNYGTGLEHHTSNYDRWIAHRSCKSGHTASESPLYARFVECTMNLVTKLFDTSWLEMMQCVHPAAQGTECRAGTLTADQLQQYIAMNSSAGGVAYDAGTEVHRGNAAGLRDSPSRSPLPRRTQQPTATSGNTRNNASLISLLKARPTQELKKALASQSNESAGVRASPDTHDTIRKLLNKRRRCQPSIEPPDLGKTFGQQYVSVVQVLSIEYQTHLTGGQSPVLSTDLDEMIEACENQLQLLLATKRKRHQGEDEKE